MEEYTTKLKTLGDPTRLRILRLLLDAGTDLCVCEFVDSLEEPQYNVSKHLVALKRSGLLQSRKDGRWVYYRPSDTPEEFVEFLYRAVGAIPSSVVARDRDELRKRLALRQDGKCLLGILKEPFLPRVVET